MLEQLAYLQSKLVNSSYSLSDLLSGVGISTTLYLPFEYSFEVHVPYILFVALDVLVYIFAFVLMFEYSRRSGSAGTTTLSRLIQLRGQQLSVALLLMFLISGAVASPGLASPVYLFGGLYTVSLATQVWKVAAISVWTVWVVFFTKHCLYQLSEIVILAFLSLGFAVTLLSTNHFILLFLVVEGISLVSYIMAAAGRQYGSVVSSIQYFIYGSMGSMVLLLGLSVLYGSFRVTSLSVWSDLLSSGFVSSFEVFSLATSSLLIIAGLLVKFGAAPVHGWVIETYANLSYHVMWFFSLFVKLIIGLLVLKVLHAVSVFGFTELIGVVSLFVGCLGALRQSEVKRLFAYGSVMHVGFLLIADFVSFQVYLVAYVLSMILIGVVVTNLRLNGQEVIYLADVAKSLSSSGPIQVLALATGLLSISGVPPLAGFWGKFSVLLPILSTSGSGGTWSFILVASILSVTLAAFFYYFRLVIWVCLGLSASSKAYSSSLSYATVLLLLVATLFGFSYILYMSYDLFLMAL